MAQPTLASPTTVLAVLPVLFLLLAGYCSPLGMASQPHFGRSAAHDTRGGNGGDLISPPYRRPSQHDEYHLAVNCTPALPLAKQYEVNLVTTQSRPGQTHNDQIDWFGRPNEAHECIAQFLPLIPISIVDAACSQAESQVPLPKDYVALVNAQRCQRTADLVRAVRRLQPTSRIFMLYSSGDRSLALSDHEPEPYVFTYERTGLAEKLVAEVMRNRSCTISINFRILGLDSIINKTSVLFVSVSFILLMIISLSWLVFYYVQRFRYLHAKERLSRRLGNAAKKALTRIPVRVLRTSDRDFNWIGDQCAVCIEPYRLADSVRILPCKHFYHRSCIDPWLLDQRTCPLCKLDILKAYGLQIRDHCGSHGSLLDGRFSPENSHSHSHGVGIGGGAGGSVVVSGGADDSIGSGGGGGGGGGGLLVVVGIPGTSGGGGIDELVPSGPPLLEKYQAQHHLSLRHQQFQQPPQASLHRLPNECAAASDEDDEAENEAACYPLVVPASVEGQQQQQQHHHHFHGNRAT